MGGLAFRGKRDETPLGMPRENAMSPTTAEAFVVAWAAGPLVRLPVEAGVPVGVGDETEARQLGTG